MKLNLTHSMRLILLVVLALAFDACVDNKYDLDKDLSLDVNVGGKNFAIPLGSTSNIYLDSLLDIEDGDILRFLENGDFALIKTDSLNIKIPKIDPVTITVEGLDIDPIPVSVDNVKLPEDFNLGNFNKNTSLGINDIQLSGDIDPISVGANKEININGEAEMPIPAGTSTTLSGNKPFDFSFQKMAEIKEIKKIYFGDTDKGSLAEVTVNLPQIVTATDHTIKTFSVTLPSGFVLAANPQNIAGTVSGNTFTVNNFDPANEKTIVFSFYIKEMTGSFTASATDIAYSGELAYSIEYQIDNGKFNAAGKANIGVNINIPLTLKSADIATNNIPVELSSQSIALSSTIENIPEEIASVKSVNFNPAANEIEINISALELPMNLSGNSVQLKFPETFHFAPSDPVVGNVLKITPAELNNGVTKKLHLTSIDLNQTVENQTITLNKEVLIQDISLQLDGSSSINTQQLESLPGKEIKVAVSGENLQISNATITTNGITVDIEPTKTDLNISEKAPKELVAIREVSFKENPKVKLQLSFQGIPASVDKIRFKDYTVTFPDFIVFEGSEVKNHQLVLNDEFKVSEGFSKTLTIQKFDFGNNNPIKDGYITINQEVKLNGQIYIAQSELNSEDLADVIIRPRLAFDRMELSIVSGKIDPQIDPERETIDIGDIPDFLKDDSVVLDIQNPLITVNAANTIGVPVKADLKMVPKFKGAPINSGIVNATILVEPAATSGVTTWSNFWISDTQEGMPSNYHYVETPNLPNLIRKIPDSISIVMDAVADPNAIHTIDLSVPEYKLQVKYNISVPLKLGNELAIVYKDTLDDFHKDIEDYIDYVTEVLVYAEAENTIPLEMLCRVDAIDVNKKILTGIQVSAPEKIKSSGWDVASGKTTPTSTKFSITLKEKVKGELAKMDGLILHISAKANSTVAGATLKRDQYVKVSAKMKVPGGINMDLDDL